MRISWIVGCIAVLALAGVSEGQRASRGRGQTNRSKAAAWGRALGGTGSGGCGRMVMAADARQARARGQGQCLQTGHGRCARQGQGQGQQQDPGMGAGGGSRGGQGCRLIQTDSTPTVEPATTSISAALKAALLQEYANQAYYKEVLDKFGSLRRFENLHAAEGRHAEAVLSLMARYGVEPAKAEEADVPEVPATLAEAIQVAIHNEEVDVALYDGLLGSDLPEDVKAVFRQLRTVSAENHLRALRRGAAGGQERGGQGFRGGRRS